jgi:hypothetical protein
VEVDEDGFAWGKDLRIRVSVRVDRPLLRGVNLRVNEEDVEGSWFDLKYEKVPHFCFDCGCIVHTNNVCEGEKLEVQQWGEWLRASPKKNQKPPPPARPSVSFSSFSARSASSDSRENYQAYIRDNHPCRDLSRTFEYSSSSRTGGYEPSRRVDEVMSPNNRHWARGDSHREGKAPATENVASKVKKGGTFSRRERAAPATNPSVLTSLPPGNGNRKRGAKQVWLPVPVRVVGEDNSEILKKQRTSSVFERIEEPADLHGAQRTDSVFDRLEDPAADPARQGRRGQ